MNKLQVRLGTVVVLVNSRPVGDTKDLPFFSMGVRFSKSKGGEAAEEMLFARYIAWIAEEF